MNRTEFIEKYISHLNEKQKIAVQTVEGPVLLLAVPGSGKTTVLVNRLGYMVFCEGIAPESILTLTYTVAATNDMARRFTSVFGEAYSNLLEFRTINGICAKIIQQYSQMIGKPSFDLVTDEKVLGKIILDLLVSRLNEYPTDSDVKTAKTLLTYCKNMMLTEKEIKAMEEDAQIPLLSIYNEYNTYLREHSLMDYDDQMIYAYRMLKSVPDLLAYYRRKYRYICVDEAQDTSKIQHVIISLLAGENGNLFMVGDEDQSIYGFRAAYPEALLHFEKNHTNAKVLVMDQNYRSNAKIVEMADLFIQHNKDRHKKHMVSTREAASDIQYIQLTTRSNQYAYLEKVASDVQRETAVLYRDNESVLPLIDRLERKSIPYQVKNVDMAFFTNRVVVDVTNILLFAMNPYDSELFMKIYFKCKTYLKKAQAEALCAISAEKNITILEAAEELQSISGMVKGKCKALKTNLKSLLHESASKALFRIEAPIGYGEYLERNNIDENKLFVLKMLAVNETTVDGFLNRLEYLKELLKNKKPSYDSKLILSTIHSSKGLEYDRVYLLDVCDGVFPAKAIRMSVATPEEKKTFEEERRLFYVGMTRAKNDLCIFQLSGNTSCFLREMKPKNNVTQKKSIRVNANKPVKYEPTYKDELIIGERVVQAKYGPGVISDVIYDGDGQADRFTVDFDSGEVREFIYPIAFRMGMRLDR